MVAMVGGGGVVRIWELPITVFHAHGFSLRRLHYLNIWNRPLLYPRPKLRITMYLLESWLKPWPNLRMRQTKIDSLFKATQTQKMTPYSVENEKQTKRKVSYTQVK